MTMARRWFVRFPPFLLQRVLVLFFLALPQLIFSSPHSIVADRILPCALLFSSYALL